MNPDVRDLIDRLGMTPLPVEGTFIVSTYRSEENTISALVVTHPDRETDRRRLGIPDDHSTEMPSGFAT
jgi:hypothetical protein